jgi:glyoxylase-like metal-dependent hydrolase (beta-lactamase superfamily II)
MQEIARGVAVVPTLIANAYLVGDRAAWVLVDTCTPGNEQRIRRAAEQRFGRGACPCAIVLTHGHFDHAGSAGPLADAWGVPIYAHSRELTYLTGESHYPPMNLAPPGFFTRLARFFPTRTVNLGPRVAALPPSRTIPGLADWETIETPGHTPGHVSFFRRSDRFLMAGDAVTTMNLDSFWGTVAKRRQVCRPPVPATIDWKDARRSVQLLAALAPAWIAAGHGAPMNDVSGELARLAEHFAAPPGGPPHLGDNVGYGAR